MRLLRNSIRKFILVVVSIGIIITPSLPVMSVMTTSNFGIAIAAVPVPTTTKPKDHLTDLMNTVDWGFVTEQYIQSLITGLLKPCFCSAFIFGFDQDFWSPSFIQENVADPGFLALLGVDLKLKISPMVDSTSQVDKGAGDGDQDNEHSRHAHFWQFPLFQMLDFAICGSADGVSLAYMSELDITWTSPAIASMLNPASLLLSGLVSSVAAIADCAAVSTIGNNTMSDLMFFSMGCWGLTYPASGRSVLNASMLESDLLFLGRTVAKAHMVAAVFATTVKHAGSTCSPMLYPIVPKDEYLFSFIYPTMKVRDPFTKFAFGVTPLIMPSFGLTIPFKESASLFLLYKHKQCCLW